MTWGKNNAGTVWPTQPYPAVGPGVRGNEGTGHVQGAFNVPHVGRLGLLRETGLAVMTRPILGVA